MHCTAGEYTILLEILYATASIPNEWHSDACSITLQHMIHYVNNNKILGLELVFTTGAGWRGEHNLVGLKLARLGSNTLYLVM